MKITDMYGKEYSSEYEWGKEEYWNKILKKIMDMRLIKNYPKIEKVYIGNASNPYNEIYLENGIMLYDEFNSPLWTIYKNNSILANRIW